jgi:glucokinase
VTEQSIVELKGVSTIGARSSISSQDGAFSCSIGIDVGGTKINAGIVDRNGNILLHHTIPTLASKGVVLERIVSAVETVMEMAEQKWTQVRPYGIGVGSAGQIDWATGEVRYGTDLIMQGHRSGQRWS